MERNNDAPTGSRSPDALVRGHQATIEELIRLSDRQRFRRHSPGSEC